MTGYIQYYKKMVGQTQRHTEPQFLSDPMSDRKKSFRQLCTRGSIQCMTRRIQNARPCVEKMQFIFFVPPKFGCTPKNEGKRVHVLPDEKICGHAAL